MTDPQRLALLNQALGLLATLQGDLAGTPIPEPVPVPPPSGPIDELDLSQVQIVGGSPDVRGWPITTSLAISSLEPFITPTFVDPGWPDVTPPGFDGSIQYTVWAFAKINGQWIGSGFIEMWRGRANCGHNDAGNVRDQLRLNWWYYVPEMRNYTPAPGNRIGFMVTSGDQRRGRGPDSVRQRSNVVVVSMP